MKTTIQIGSKYFTTPELQSVEMYDFWPDDILQIVSICKLRSGLAFAFRPENAEYWKDLANDRRKTGHFMSFETDKFRVAGNFDVIARTDGTFSIASDEELSVYQLGSVFGKE